MKRKLVYVLFAVLAVPGLVLAQGAPGDHGTPNGPPDERPPADAPRLQFPPKDPQCVADCRTELAVCVEDAREASLPCLTAAQELRNQAREACRNDPQLDECRQTRTEAHQRLRACWDELGPPLQECVADARTCIGDCPVIEDQECWANCEAERRGCVVGVREGTRTCRQECGAAVQTAQQACRGARGSEVCQAANALVRECVGQCASLVRDGLDVCAEDLQVCTSLCVAGEDPPAGP